MRTRLRPSSSPWPELRWRCLPGSLGRRTDASLGSVWEPTEARSFLTSISPITAGTRARRSCGVCRDPDGAIVTALAARLWRTGTTQATGSWTPASSPSVHLTGVDLVVEPRIGAGVELHSSPWLRADSCTSPIPRNRS